MGLPLCNAQHPQIWGLWHEDSFFRIGFLMPRVHTGFFHASSFARRCFCAFGCVFIFCHDEKLGLDAAAYVQHLCMDHEWKVPHHMLTPQRKYVNRPPMLSAPPQRVTPLWSLANTHPPKNCAGRFPFFHPLSRTPPPPVPSELS